MIKYFYCERNLIDGCWIIKNEKILYKKPITFDNGYRSWPMSKGYKFYIDVEKMINNRGKLYEDFQEIYNKLLIETRNKKLETL